MIRGCPSSAWHVLALCPKLMGFRQIYIYNFNGPNTLLLKKSQISDPHFYQNRLWFGATDFTKPNILLNQRNLMTSNKFPSGDHVPISSITANLCHTLPPKYTITWISMDQWIFNFLPVSANHMKYLCNRIFLWRPKQTHSKQCISIQSLLKPNQNSLYYLLSICHYSNHPFTGYCSL